ncbi:MAG: hypothetical protein RIS79_2438 [Verrucomicrobiota bacterium]|jgi:hypothetical protein
MKSSFLWIPFFWAIFTAPLLAVWPEATDAEKALSARLSAAEPSLQKGDVTPLDEAFRKKDIDLLWEVFRGSSFAWDKDPYKDRINAHVRKLLLAYPGSVQYLGDRIEESSKTHEMNHVREKALGMLGDFGGPEAIAQLGRFILDDRNPLPPWVIPGKTIGSLPNPNSTWAAWAMDRALREESPWWPYRINGQPASSYGGGPPIYDLMKQWWIETGSKKYGQGIPPSIHQAPKPKPPPPAVIDSRPAATQPWAWEVPVIIALVLLSALLVLVKKRPQAPR